MKSMERQMALAGVVNKRLAEQAKEQYKEDSRYRLLKIIKKKLLTTTIGSLSVVEEEIGRPLWGHGLPESECSPEQLAWRKIWESCRNKILNNGNNQIRAVEKEIPQYTVKWERYNTVMPVVGN
jgi:hypothetical protein